MRLHQPRRRLLGLLLPRLGRHGDPAAIRRPKLCPVCRASPLPYTYPFRQLTPSPPPPQQCILSTFYLLAHIAAAIRGPKLYDSTKHNVKYEYAPTLDRKFKPFIHILHAWARLLGLLTLLGWVSAMAFVTTLFVHRTNAALVASLSPPGAEDAAAEARDAEKAMYYLRFDMAACAVGVAGSLALSLMLWCVARPYGVGFYKKYEEEKGGGGGEMSVREVGRKRCSSTTDAGSVMSGETAVSASAGTGDGAGCDELTLKGDGGEQPEPEKARPQQMVPGGYPGEA